MQRHLQIFLLIVLAITLIVLIRQIRAKKLELEYTLTWLFLLFVLLAFGCHGHCCARQYDILPRLLFCPDHYVQTDKSRFKNECGE